MTSFVERRGEDGFTGISSFLVYCLFPMITTKIIVANGT